MKYKAGGDMLLKKSVLITLASATERILKILFLTTSYARVDTISPKQLELDL